MIEILNTLGVAGWLMVIWLGLVGIGVLVIGHTQSVRDYLAAQNHAAAGRRNRART